MKAMTIATMVHELIEDRMNMRALAKLPHIIGSRGREHRQIEDLSPEPEIMEGTVRMKLTLDDGSMFAIDVTPLHRGVFEEKARDEPWKDDE